jgi:hypothetical protein
MGHATEHITDPRVHRLRVSSGRDAVLFGWDYPGATLLEVRIVRSTERFARGPDDPACPIGQRIVFQGIAGSFKDTDVEPGRRYFYTVFARRPGGQEWTRWGRKRVVAGQPYRPGLLARLLARVGRAWGR